MLGKALNHPRILGRYYTRQFTTKEGLNVSWNYGNLELITVRLTFELGGGGRYMRSASQSGWSV